MRVVFQVGAKQRSTTKKYRTYTWSLTSEFNQGFHERIKAMPLQPRINKYALVTDLSGAKEKFARKITGNTRKHISERPAVGVDNRTREPD